MSAPATLGHLREFVIAGARRIQRGFTAPGDDWASCAFIQTPDGVEVIPLPNALLATGLSKDVLAAFLRQRIASSGAYRYALLLNMHMMTLEDADDLEFMQRVRSEETRVEQHPRAVEQLDLFLGDAETEELWTCRIIRDGIRPPRLGSWQDSGFDTITGRFTGLNSELRLAREERLPS